MAKLHIGNTIIKLPIIRSVHTSGKDIVLVFRGIYPPFIYTPNSDDYITDFDIDDIKFDYFNNSKKLSRPVSYFESFEILGKSLNGLQKENEKELVSEKFPKRSRCKKS